MLKDNLSLRRVVGRSRVHATRATGTVTCGRGAFNGLVRGTGLLSAVVILGTTFGLPLAAGVSTLGGVPRLIDTTRIVGFPQRTMLSQPASQDGPGAPVITPVSETVALGATASFSASGSGFIVYWSYSANGGSSWAKLSNGTQSDGSTVTGATTATLGITDAQADENNNKYEATFVGFNSVTTNAATLTVTGAPPTNTAPVIPPQGQPSPDNVVVGATASFSASASGTPTPTVQWQVSTNSGSSWANLSNGTQSDGSTVTGATTDTLGITDAQADENNNEYRAVFTNGVSPNATTSEALLTVTAAPPSPPVQSSNWSGYADTGATFSAVSASWSVPTVTCQSRATAYSAHWIGIDGDSSSTVEQDGTEADCLNGSASYDAWYEMFGDSAVNSGYEVELSPSQYPVSHGDLISASVSVVGTTWTLYIADSSRWTFSTTVNFSGAAQSSAEWIVERPETCRSSWFGGETCSLTSLADFGSVSFSNATATTTGGSSGPISSYSYTAIEMVNGSTVLAVPGPLNGEGFTDTWKAI